MKNGMVEHEFRIFSSKHNYMLCSLKCVNVNISILWYYGIIWSAIEVAVAHTHHIGCSTKPPNQIKYQYRFILIASSSKKPSHIIAYYFVPSRFISVHVRVCVCVFFKDYILCRILSVSLWIGIGCSIQGHYSGCCMVTSLNHN